MAKEKTAKFSVIALALAAGITWGLGCLIAGWASIYGWGNAFVSTMASLYIGYEPSFIGGIIGGIWGFGDGFFFGLVLAYFYNVFRK